MDYQHVLGKMTDAAIKHNILADNIKEMVEDRIVNKDSVAAARTLTLSLEQLTSQLSTETTLNSSLNKV